MTPKLLGLALTFLMLAACGTVDETLPDAGADTSADASADAGGDVSADLGPCGPDPSQTCLDTGCDEGYTCAPSDADVCVPSACGCTDGTWDCTADCGQAYACVPETEPSECDAPDPSQTCMTTGCDEGYECVQDPDACVSGGCVCSDGAWVCTDDCNPGYECVLAENSDLCPASPPIGDTCTTQDLSCSWGQECCCGACFPATVCDCRDGEWACYATDACFIESCVGRTCDNDTDCEGGGVEATCVEGVCAHVEEAEWTAGPEIPLTIGACGDAADAYELLSVAVEGDMLNLSLAYSGGCATHEFRVCWSGEFSDAAVVPVETTLELRHNGHADACLAYPTEALQVPIADIAEAYRVQFGGDAGSVRLLLDTMNAVYTFD